MGIVKIGSWFPFQNMHSVCCITMQPQEVHTQRITFWGVMTIPKPKHVKYKPQKPSMDGMTMSLGHAEASLLVKSRHLIAWLVMLLDSEFSWDCGILVLDLLCMASLCCMIMAA